MDGAAGSLHQGNGKLVACRASLFPRRNQKALLAAVCGKERAEMIFGSVLLGLVGQHEQSGFMGAGLPSGQKTVRGGECGHVIGIGDRLDLGASEPCSEGQSKNNAEKDGFAYATDTHNAIMPEEVAPKNNRRASL